MSLDLLIVLIIGLLVFAVGFAMTVIFLMISAYVKLMPLQLIVSGMVLAVGVGAISFVIVEIKG